MTTPAASVAILLFARSVKQEAAHKQFVSHGGPEANAAVAAQLTAHAAATAQQLGVDFLHIDSARQQGNSFGERLTGAMQHAFAQGYEHLLVMGNDCPQLDVALLRRTLPALATCGVVLGPATDGGVYLLGVARQYFDPATWTGLPWQTNMLGNALAARAKAAGAVVHYLPCLADVDNEQDLAQVLQRPLAQPLLRALRQLRRCAHGRPPRRHRPQPGLLVEAAHPHRGPPTR